MGLDGPEHLSKRGNRCSCRLAGCCAKGSNIRGEGSSICKNFSRGVALFPLHFSLLALDFSFHTLLLLSRCLSLTHSPATLHPQALLHCDFRTMPIHFPLPFIFTLHFVVLALLFSTLSIPSIHAQKFQPIPVAYPAYASIEGQGFYIIGGAKEAITGTSITQAFMIDLSVSWNASDPVFKKLPEGPGSAFAPTTVLSDGDIFTLHIGVGYIYKVKSNSWTLFGNSKFPIQTGYAATNPESGLVYIAFGTNSTLHVLDPSSKTLNTLKVPRLTNVADTQELVWSAHLRSVILSTVDPSIMYVFTPSKVSESSHGWSLMNTTGFQPAKTFLLQACFVPAYGGSKVITITVLDESNSTISMAQILDIPTGKWTASPTMALRAGGACGVSGDYFIVWGGGTVKDLERFTDGIVVYNMKTNEFVSGVHRTSSLVNTNST